MAKLVRPIVYQDKVSDAFDAVYLKLQSRLRKKGYGSFAGKHEILGILQAVQSQPLTGEHSVREELIDIAVRAIFGVACIDAGHIFDEHAQEVTPEAV